MSSLSDIQVLVVDDNRQMRVLTRALLRAAGVYRVAEASGALEAFDLMNRFPVDLILADWKMKPVDGLAFTKMVRGAEDSPNPYVPILMMTAHTEMSRVAAARDAGVNGFVRKPISARILFERMSGALLDTRPFVKTASYVGPDRRHGQRRGFAGPYRRAGEENLARLPAADPVFDMLDLDDVRWRA
jgi:two-component system chemotaxis response regulator CheY